MEWCLNIERPRYSGALLLTRFARRVRAVASSLARFARPRSDGKGQRVYKPGFVLAGLTPQCAIIHLGRSLLNASCNQPERPLQHGISVPIWFCSGWGLPCKACCHAHGALLPHPFSFSRAFFINENCTSSLLSVALSLGSPPPAINRHPIAVEPGLSSDLKTRDCPTLWRNGL
ncbi:hypothetical protein DES40_1055 [Litorimonas taeanensis]|uniref:Uncharacterized protein n=1 Tax=Litorimonas taeanensis TaxID=568099 RepID=A0A420WL31_9PROT|nr:hypothetical protein DES40_1055 [Litorimonas taeanensis]